MILNISKGYGKMKLAEKTIYSYLPEKVFLSRTIQCWLIPLLFCAMKYRDSRWKSILLLHERVPRSQYHKHCVNWLISSCHLFIQLEEWLL